MMLPSSSGRAASDNALRRTPLADGRDRHGTGASAAPDLVRTESARRGRWHAASDANLDGEQLREALAQLSDCHRAMIYRSYYLGQTTTQIAAEFRTTDDIVKNELHHALHALRMTVHTASG